MGHGHDHNHEAGHSRLAIALVATLGFMGVEAVTGWLTGSLALLADSGHMMSDASALGVALLAARLARRPPDDRRTLGWRRAEVLGATVNASLLLVIAVLIVMEAVKRVAEPHPVDAGPMLAVATLGLLVNLSVAWMLSRGESHDINTRAALWHVMGDAAGSVGAMVAGGLILAFGWSQADPVVSFLIAGIIGVGAVRILREAVDVLMQAAPEGVQLDALRATLLQEPGVSAIHDLHLWSIAPGSNVLSVHVVLIAGEDPQDARARIDARLREQVELQHVTIQVEVGDTACGAGNGPSAARSVR